MAVPTNVIALADGVHGVQPYAGGRLVAVDVRQWPLPQPAVVAAVAAGRVLLERRLGRRMQRQPGDQSTQPPHQTPWRCQYQLEPGRNLLVNAHGGLLLPEPRDGANCKRSAGARVAPPLPHLGLAPSRVNPTPHAEHGGARGACRIRVGAAGLGARGWRWRWVATAMALNMTAGSNGKGSPLFTPATGSGSKRQSTGSATRRCPQRPQAAGGRAGGGPGASRGGTGRDAARGLYEAMRRGRRGASRHARRRVPGTQGSPARAGQRRVQRVPHQRPGARRRPRRMSWCEERTDSATVTSSCRRASISPDDLISL